jgi:hypothetical protein
MRTNMLFAVVIAILVASCEKNGSKPEINFQELGMDNSKTALIGGELHVEAEILAENKIDQIEIGLHPEDNSQQKSIATYRVEDGWEFDTVYSKFSGLRNTHVHEHIEIPASAEPGHYHFHFSVTDMEGYRAEYTDELELLVSEGQK